MAAVAAAAVIGSQSAHVSGLQKLIISTASATGQVPQRSDAARAVRDRCVRG
jgi:hypothetical protein